MSNINLKSKGKKPTYQQRSLLVSQGIKDTTDWLYMGQETIDDQGYARLSKNDPKSTYMNFRNRVTGECKSIQV